MVSIVSVIILIILVLSYFALFAFIPSHAIVSANSSTNTVSKPEYGVLSSIPTSNTSSAMLYDPANNEIYIANAKNITLVSPATFGIVGAITLANATTLMYDSNDRKIFTGIDNENRIAVVNATTNEVLNANISLPAPASYMVYVLDTDGVYLARRPANIRLSNLFNVTVLNAKTNNIISSINVGACFCIGPLVYDSVNHYIYVCVDWETYPGFDTSATDNITTISDSTKSIVSMSLVAIGQEPQVESLAVDPNSGNIYGSVFFARGQDEDFFVILGVRVCHEPCHALVPLTLSLYN